MGANGGNDDQEAICGEDAASGVCQVTALSHRSPPAEAHDQGCGLGTHVQAVVRVVRAVEEPGVQPEP